MEGAANKKERLSVAAFLDKTKPKSSKPKPKPKPNQDNNAYTSGMDLPPSDNEDDEERAPTSGCKEEIAKRRGSDKSGLGLGPLRNISSAGSLPVHCCVYPALGFGFSHKYRGYVCPAGFSDKYAMKKAKQHLIATRAAEIAQQEAMTDDHSAFSVVIGTRSSVEVDANLKDISIESFSVSVRGKELFKNASLRISHGRRYGLVGPNGKGKSALLKLLARRQVPVPKNIDLLLLEQEVVGDNRSALEVVVSADEELIKLREEATRLQQNLNLDDDDGPDTPQKLTEIYENLQEMGSDAAEAHASKILAGLGFTKAMQMRPTKSFSGGWRMRISLARALFVQPTLLLLDEPTNHLDLRALLWLDEYLSRWKKTLVMVSHDRDFLNSVCTDIIHLHDEKLHYYRGNFDAFETAYEQKRKESKKASEISEKQLMAGKRSGKEVRAKGKGKAPILGAPKRWRDYSVQFHFPEPMELSTHPLLQLVEVHFRYPGQDDFGLQGVDVGVDMGTRVAIVGPNGAGKSTLLNLLAGDIQPLQGESRRSQKLRIGRYSQHFVDLLTMHETAVQYLLRLYPGQEGPSKQETVRAKLGKFGLPSHNHHTPIVKLSGGQKARVVFTAISMAKPHILLLDEPTNHLDMQSIDALADALDEFSGGVVLVSHDSRLISRVCEDEERSEVWVVDDGVVRRYPGSFAEYKDELEREIRAHEGHD